MYAAADLHWIKIGDFGAARSWIVPGKQLVGLILLPASARHVSNEIITINLYVFIFFSFYFRVNLRIFCATTL
jgi:hypothetical protein